jgi:DNA-binding response OmpR family regulator
VSKQSLLLVDGDTRSLRVLEVSLRKAGFTVTPAASVSDALDKLELDTPDLIISETKFPTDLDGFELRRRVRGSTDWAEIPFVFLTAETAIEHKIRGLELGVDDYLTKPIYIKEIVTRINILLQKRQRAHFDERKDGVRFAGRVADMPVVDVIQTIEVSRKSGVIQFVADRHRTAAIYFRDGKVIDAEAGSLQGEDAVYRLLTWSEGEFEVVFRTVRRREVITTSSQGLLMEGMRRLDEWSRLLEQLPPLTHRFEIDTPELAGRLGEVPDDNNPILRVIDGKRSLLEVIDASEFGDLECLQAISKLYFEGLLVDLDPEQRPRRDTGKPMPLVIVESSPTPIERVASGPLAVEREPDEIDKPAEPAPRPKAPSEPPPVAAEPAPAVEDTTASGSVEVGESEVLSEEDIPGPLMGGYRNSSLRLIDEAVAAAQAIDPSLFESDLISSLPEPKQLARVQVKPQRESDPRIANARGVIEKEGGPRQRPKSVPPGIKDAIRRADASAEIPLPTDEEIAAASTSSPADTSDSGAADSGRPARARPERSGDDGSDPIHAAPDAEIVDDDSGVPTAIESEDESSGASFDDEPEEPTEPERPPFIARRDTSGLRMTSSHGHDRAETSGELDTSPRAPGAELRTDHERELVTILPRRITREVPITGDSPAAGPSPALDGEEASPPGAEPRAATPTLPPPPRYSVAGGVARATGPGPLVMVLVVLASLMAGMAVYLYVHKRHRQPAVAALRDAGAVEMNVIDATQLALEPDARPDARIEAPVAPDAAVRVAAVIDAGVVAPRPDAAVRVVATADAGVDHNKEASRLKDEAAAALADGDTAHALELAEQSLQLRKTAQAYLVEARALQRSGRTDDAITAATAARDLAPGYYMTHHELGMILMSARRNADARPELEKYLELAPNDKDADTVRQLLAAPSP